MADNIQNQFHCSGDCLNCRATKDRKIQWQYCAAQFSYNALRTMQTMTETITAMSGEIGELKAKIEAIQDSESLVFDPSTETLTETPTPTIPTAQEGVGA